MRRFIHAGMGILAAAALLGTGCEREPGPPPERIAEVRTEVERKGDKVEVERKVKTLDGEKYEEEVEVPR